MDKPVVVISSCLAGFNVRYDGGSARDSFVKKLLKYVQPVYVCPEVDAGLPVPRRKVFLVKENGLKLYQEETQKDLTDLLKSFSERFLGSLSIVDGFVLKAKSPSCGITGAKTYKNKDRTDFVGRKKGIFASQVKRFFPYHPAEDELRLKNKGIRLVFLTKLFLFFYFRTEGAEYVVNRFGKILEIYNKRGFNSFKKQPDGTNFQKIFTKSISSKKISHLKDYYSSKKLFLFPLDLL